MTFSFPKHSFLKIKSIFVSGLMLKGLLNSLITCVLVTQSCLTLWYPTDCSPPGSSVHGILQARILECVAIPLQGVFLIQGLNSGLLHCRWILSWLRHLNLVNILLIVLELLYAQNIFSEDSFCFFLSSMPFFFPPNCLASETALNRSDDLLIISAF